MTPREPVCVVLVPLLWGVQHAIVKIGLAVFPPLFFLGLRFAVVALILLPFVGCPTTWELEVILLSTFLGGLNSGLAFVGLTGAPASVTGIADQLWSPFTLILAWPLLGERLSWHVVVGILIAFAGVSRQEAPTSPAATLASTTSAATAPAGTSSPRRPTSKRRVSATTRSPTALSRRRGSSMSCLGSSASARPNPRTVHKGKATFSTTIFQGGSWSTS